MATPPNNIENLNIGQGNTILQLKAGGSSHNPTNQNTSEVKEQLINFLAFYNREDIRRIMDDCWREAVSSSVSSVFTVSDANDWFDGFHSRLEYIKKDEIITRLDCRGSGAVVTERQLWNDVLSDLGGSLSPCPGEDLRQEVLEVIRVLKKNRAQQKIILICVIDPTQLNSKNVEIIESFQGEWRDMIGKLSAGTSPVYPNKQSDPGHLLDGEVPAGHVRMTCIFNVNCKTTILSWFFRSLAERRKQQCAKKIGELFPDSHQETLSPVNQGQAFQWFNSVNNFCQANNHQYLCTKYLKLCIEEQFRSDRQQLPMKRLLKKVINNKKIINELKHPPHQKGD